jgi:hypothetical protein
VLALALALVFASFFDELNKCYFVKSRYCNISYLIFSEERGKNSFTTEI